MSHDTSATRVVQRGGTEECDAPASGPVRARAPRAARPATPPPAPGRPAAGRRGRRAAEQAPRRAAAAAPAGRWASLLVLLLLAAGVGIAYVITSNSADAIELRNVMYDDAGRIIDELEGLVRDNIR